ncbi:MAG: hypothetical protein ABIG39_07765 [Candidatus Micrarchaeota archaeon]
MRIYAQFPDKKPKKGGGIPGACSRALDFFGRQLQSSFKPSTSLRKDRSTLTVGDVLALRRAGANQELFHTALDMRTPREVAQEATRQLATTGMLSTPRLLGIALKASAAVGKVAVGELEKKKAERALCGIAVKTNSPEITRVEAVHAVKRLGLRSKLEGIVRTLDKQDPVYLTAKGILENNLQ